MEHDLLVISNAKAGGADERVLQEVLAVLRRGGTDVCSETLGSPDQLDALLGAHPRRLPVAAGGDGTLHLLVAALHARAELASRVVGLVPLGTGNDFARTVGVPLAPAAAARVVLQGAPHEMDLLTDDAGGVVINAVHLGIGAESAREGEPLKPVFGMLAYRIGALLAGMRSPGWPVQVSVDDATITDGNRRVLQIGVLNGRTIGGGTPLAPHAEPDDGLADVVVCTAVGPIARVRYAWLLRQGRHSDHPDVVVTRGRRVELAGPPIPINSDGELGDGVSHRKWTVHRRAWRVLAPAAIREASRPV
ncbi:MAG TPA: diacylglycerol kinase family protein [Pseudonocardiaceae bacterium]|nr:diacylglycerol kinase family protein [Pseudonocardiaceae bacterium]